jgi:hypothetical protein
MREGYDGAVAWAESPSEGLSVKSGIGLTLVKLGSEFNRPLKLKQLFPTLSFKETKKVGDKEAQVIEALSREGPVERWYFDTQTGLLIRQEIEVDTPQGKTITEIYAVDYREADGVKIAFRVRILSPSSRTFIETKEVKHNVPIDDSKFAKPKAK